MRTLLARIDRMADVGANVLAIGLGSLIVVVAIGSIYASVLEAVLEPIYAYLVPRLGLAFVFVAFGLLVLLGTLGELLGEVMATIPGERAAVTIDGQR